MDNNITPYAHAIFCDDVRNEYDGKVSIIGIYSDCMTIVSKTPCAIPKFCIVAWLRVPKNVTVNEMTVLISGEPFGPSPGRMKFDPPESPTPDILASEYKTAQAAVISSPFWIHKSGIIEVSVETDIGTFLAGKISVIVAPPPEA